MIGLVIIDVQPAHMSGIVPAEASRAIEACRNLLRVAEMHAMPIAILAASLGGAQPPVEESLAHGIESSRVVSHSAADGYAALASVDVFACDTLVFCGVATDVGVYLTARSARLAGKSVIVALDACAGMNAAASSAAALGLTALGVELMSWAGVAAMLQGDFSAPYGRDVLALIGAVQR